MFNKVTSIYIVLLIFLFLRGEELAAHEKINNLENYTIKSTKDTIDIETLNDIAWELRASDPARAINLIDSVIIRAKAENKYTILADAYNHLGVIYANAGDYKGAVEWILKGNNLSHEIGDSVGIAKAMNNMALIYWHRNMLDKSLEYLNLSLEIHKKSNSIKYLGIAYNNIGTIYKERGEFKKAIEYLNTSIRYLDSTSNHIIKIKAKFNLAESYLGLNMKKEALEELFEGENICQKTANMADCCDFYLIKGQYFESEQQYKQAEQFYKKAINLSDKINNFIIKSKALNQLSKLYVITKNFEKAYKMQDSYHKLKDSVNSMQNYILLSRLEVQNEFDEKLDKQTKRSELKEQMQKAEIAYQKRVRNFLLIGFFFFLLLAFIAILNYRQKLKSAKMLAIQRQEILMKNDALREQMEADRMKTELLEFINEENEILSLVAKETDNTVFILSPDGKIEWVNEAFHRLSGFTFEEFKRTRGKNILEASSSEAISENLRKCINTKKPVSYASKTETKHKEDIWIHTTLTPVLNENDEITRIIAIDADITKIKEAEEQIALKNQEITWSLQYARRMQKALLPLESYLTSLFPQHFVINLPQTIVSGDFYWVTQKNEQTLAAVADSTGHGVPGAFMSLLGISALQEVAGKMDELEPAKILEQLREKIIYLLHYHDNVESTEDSLDIALCVINNRTKVMNYAGSNNSAFILRDDVLIELKPDKYFIWDSETNQKAFTLKTFQLLAEDRIYMFTDGFSDQFGGESDKKYSRRRLKKLLLDIYTLPMETQKDLLHMELENWQGKNEQIDDIMVLAFQV
ncbi:MAG: tetratricopeptide repeat protein [Bacteroidales bacterium]|nr:tetratricopeptide repeat protein [Bacteroidales bacterium]